MSLIRERDRPLDRIEPLKALLKDEVLHFVRRK